MLQSLGHLNGWLRNTLLINAHVCIYIYIYILFALLIPPTPGGSGYIIGVDLVR